MGAPSKSVFSTLVVARAAKGLNPSSAQLLAASLVPDSDRQLISVHKHQGSLSVLDHHSAEDCYFLVIFRLSIYFVWKESSPWICSIVFADAWKLHIFRNICIFLAIQLFFMIFWLGLCANGIRFHSNLSDFSWRNRFFLLVWKRKKVGFSLLCRIQ